MTQRISDCFVIVENEITTHKLLNCNYMLELSKEMSKQYIIASKQKVVDHSKDYLPHNNISPQRKEEVLTDVFSIKLESHVTTGIREEFIPDSIIGSIDWRIAITNLHKELAVLERSTIYWLDCSSNLPYFNFSINAMNE